MSLVPFFTIKKRAEFLKTCKFGSRAKTERLSVVCYKFGEGLAVGYTASKKVGKAVKRNKAKRRLRSLVFATVPILKFGYRFVFIANSNTVDCKFSDLQSDFLYCVKKAMKRASENESCE
ncbi:MAG: ribonuclease P protein component [Holosporales bacterium]|jgi:ribonuclease P protein component|nr:ribonuclease P protein component [Holosporales bacterium]